MPEWPTLALFLTASLALLVVPGPAVLYIVTRSIHQGRQAGLVSALGVGAGSLVHMVAATLGLSALLLSSAVAFTVVKYAGAAYLVYLGLRTLLGRGGPRYTEAIAPQTLSRIFSQGVVVNVLNPKTALFFFAFFPQFVDPSKGDVAGQTLLLGAIFTVLGVCSDSLYALLAGAAGSWLKGNAQFLRTQRYVAGSVYIGLGVTTALAGSAKK